MRIHLTLFVNGIHRNTDRLHLNSFNGLTWNRHRTVMKLNRIHIIRKSERLNPLVGELDF